MLGFENTLDYKEVGESNGRVVLELNSPLVYFSKSKGRIEIPSGFWTDLASVPRLPLVFLLWGNRAHREAVLHDYLYRIDSEPCVSYKEANFLFKEAMISRGQPSYIYFPMFLGVSLKGRKYYHISKITEKYDLSVVY